MNNTFIEEVKWNSLIYTNCQVILHFRAHQRDIQIEKEKNMFWHKKIRIIRMHVVVRSKRMRCFSDSLNLSQKKKLSTE